MSEREPGFLRKDERPITVIGLKPRAWFVVQNNVVIDGPFESNAAALMRLTSFPSASVERRDV